MFKNVASQKFTVFAFDSTTNLPKTGDAANLTGYIAKDNGSVTVLGDTSATELDSTNAKGFYQFDGTQAETNADQIMLTGKSSTSNIVVVGVPAMIFTNPAKFTTLVIDAAGLVDSNAVKLGPSGSGTAQTARDVGASVIAASVSTGGIAATSFAAGAIDNASIAANAIGASEMATDAVTEIANGILDLADVVGTGVTVRKALRGYAAALLAKASGQGTTTAKFRDLDDAKDAITATVDSSGNRTVVTLDLT